MKIVCMLFVATLHMAPAILADTTVQQAYEHRLNGEARIAHQMLEQIVAKHPQNAKAWCELARTRCHIGLGDPRSMAEGIKEIQTACHHAAELEPDNLIYAIWKAKSCALDAYISIKQQAPNSKERIQTFISASERVLELNPNYHEAKLALLELLKALPPEAGGNPQKAEQYAKELEKVHPIYGAQARELMLPPDSDLVAFWQKMLKQHPDNPDVFERLGKAYLYQQQSKRGIEYLRQAIQLDAGKNTLHLDIARHCIYQAMRDQEQLKTLAPKMNEAFEAYINSKPTPPNPMLAYAKGWQGRIKSRSGDQAGGNRLREEAKALDPDHSKATGLPDQNLFIPPDQIPHGFIYLTRPF